MSLHPSTGASARVSTRWTSRRPIQSWRSCRKARECEDFNICCGGPIERHQGLATQHAEETGSISGVSGFEQEVVGYVRDRLQASADEVKVDQYGKVIGSRRGREKAPKLGFSAHMDEIGFIVKSIQPDCYLRFDRMSGAGDGLLSCREVRVSGHLGLIRSKSGHHGSPEELMRVTPIHVSGRFSAAHPRN
jgi:hypothetical protein